MLKTVADQLQRKPLSIPALSYIW